MADQPTLQITRRHETGSHVARRLRRQGRIPGILYGHGEPEAVSLDAAEFRGTIRPAQYGSQMVHIRIDDRESDTALVKAVQINPLGQRILNVDLQRVSLQDEIVVSVPVILEGEPKGARAGGVLEQLLHTVALRCAAENIPEAITVDISELEIGDAVHPDRLALPADTELAEMTSDVIAVLAASRLAAAEEAETPVEEGVSGPELTEDKQKDDFPPER